MDFLEEKIMDKESYKYVTYFLVVVIIILVLYADKLCKRAYKQGYDEGYNIGCEETRLEYED